MAVVGNPPLTTGTFNLVDQDWLAGLAGGQNWAFTSKIAAHAGGGQQLATPLKPGSLIYQVDTVANENDSIALPAAAPPYFFLIYNASDNDLTLFSAFNTSDEINGSPGFDGVSVSSGNFIFCTCAEPGQWAVGGGGSGGGGSGSVRTINNYTTNHTLVLADAGAIVEMSVASGNMLTIPPNSSVDFPVGTEIDFMQIGPGVTTIAAGVGVTILSASTSLQIAAQYDGGSMYQRATDVWVVQGALAS